MRHIPAHQVAAGSRVFAVPRDATTPRGPKLDNLPTKGMVVTVDDYLHGCIQRGAVVAYAPELAGPPQTPKPPAEPAPDAPADETEPS